MPCTQTTPPTPSANFTGPATRHSTKIAPNHHALPRNDRSYALRIREDSRSAHRLRQLPRVRRRGSAPRRRRSRVPPRDARPSEIMHPVPARVRQVPTPHQVERHTTNNHGEGAAALRRCTDPRRVRNAGAIQRRKPQTHHGPLPPSREPAASGRQRIHRSDARDAQLRPRSPACPPTAPPAPATPTPRRRPERGRRGPDPQAGTGTRPRSIAP